MYIVGLQWDVAQSADLQLDVAQCWSTVGGGSVLIYSGIWQTVLIYSRRWHICIVLVYSGM